MYLLEYEVHLWSYCIDTRHAPFAYLWLKTVRCFGISWIPLAEKWKSSCPSLSELLLPEASFPAHDIMMSRPSTTFAFDFKGLIESCPIPALSGLLEEERVWYPRQVSGVLAHQPF